MAEQIDSLYWISGAPDSARDSEGNSPWLLKGADMTDSEYVMSFQDMGESEREKRREKRGHPEHAEFSEAKTFSPIDVGRFQAFRKNGQQVPLRTTPQILLHKQLTGNGKRVPPPKTLPSYTAHQHSPNTRPPKRNPHHTTSSILTTTFPPSRYRTLQTRLTALEAQRALQTQILAQRKHLQTLLAPFKDPQETVQPNLVTRDGELGEELDRMRLLIARVAGRVAELEPMVDDEDEEEVIVRMGDGTRGFEGKLERVMEL